MSQRDRALANRLSHDPEVSNRLIQQALYFLGVGPRKQAFDRKLAEFAYSVCASPASRRR